jgi:hypothetical protein
MSYQTLLHELAPDLNPAGIEASMRLHYGTLNYLPRETFVVEAKLAADLEAQSPGILRRIAESMGMENDFTKWEASHAA